MRPIGSFSQVCALLGMTLLTLPALAQEASAPPAPAPTAAPVPAEAKAIEEIIVTAERRDQNIQDVAQTITAFTPEDLEQANIQDAYDLQLKVPGLVATGGLPAITLRGLGQDSDVLGPASTRASSSTSTTSTCHSSRSRCSGSTTSSPWKCCPARRARASAAIRRAAR